jgi:hypothetical protein
MDFIWFKGFFGWLASPLPVAAANSIPILIDPTGAAPAIIEKVLSLMGYALITKNALARKRAGGERAVKRLADPGS